MNAGAKRTADLEDLEDLFRVQVPAKRSDLFSTCTLWAWEITRHVGVLSARRPRALAHPQPARTGRCGRRSGGSP